MTLLRRTGLPDSLGTCSPNSVLFIDSCSRSLISFQRQELINYRSSKFSSSRHRKLQPLRQSWKPVWTIFRSGNEQLFIIIRVFASTTVPGRRRKARAPAILRVSPGATRKFVAILLLLKQTLPTSFHPIVCPFIWFYNLRKLFFWMQVKYWVPFFSAQLTGFSNFKKTFIPFTFVLLAILLFLNQLICPRSWFH